LTICVQTTGLCQIFEPKLFPPVLQSVFYGNILKRHLEIGALVLKKWEQKTNYCSTCSSKPQIHIWDRLFYLYTITSM